MSLRTNARHFKNEHLNQVKRGNAFLSPPKMPSPFEDGGKWTLAGGDGRGWQGGRYYKIRGLAVFRDRLFASLSGPNTDGPIGQVWAFDGWRWELVGGNSRNSWPSRPAFVEHLFASEQHLYAGVRGSVWRFDGESWSDIGGGQPWHGATDRGAYCFASYRNGIAAGFWGSAEVRVYDGHKWSQIAGRGSTRSWPTPDKFKTVYSLAAFRGDLYAGPSSGSFTGDSTGIWRFAGDRWERVGGRGVRGSWLGEGIPFALSMTVYQDHLIVTLSRPPGTMPSASSVWAFDGDQWRPIASGEIPDLMSRSLILNDSIAYRDHFLVATGDGTHRQAALWQLTTDQTWDRVAGVEVFGSGVPDSPGGHWIYRLSEYRGDLYAAMAGHRGAAMLWRYIPPGETGGSVARASDAAPQSL